MALFQLDPQSRHAIAIAMALANADAPPSVRELGRATGLSPIDVAFALAHLVEAKLVARSDDGFRFFLAIPAAALCLAEVVSAADPQGEFDCQFGQSGCTRGSRCHPCWALLEAEFRATETLEKVKLVELLRPTS